MNHKPWKRTDWSGKRVLVVGLGSFDGGLGAVRFLLQQNAQVTISDLKSPEKLRNSIAAVEAISPDGIVWSLGEHDVQLLDQTDLLVINPAVDKSSELIQAALSRGIPWTSEMNLFLERNRGYTIAVTGSNGKSTTTAMIHHILSLSQKRVWLGGNIGKSLLDRVEEIHSDDYVVLELSSFQLEDTANLPWSPQVAVVTNFAPNHLDRHKTLENYRAAKQNILRSQSASDRAILNTDDVDVWSWPATGTRIGFGITDPGSPGVFLKGKQVLFRSENQELLTSLPEWVPLPGAHNLANALAAAAAIMPRPKQPAAATWSIGTPIEQIEQGLRTYRALPHRLELITERGGRRFYNDSLATTPESAQMALRSFDAPIVLLAGGYDKGIDLTDFVREITQSNVRGVAWMGQLGQGLEQTRVSLDPMNKLKTRVCLSFPEAMQFAVNVSQPGDVILLSPGCASYDWFQNFADRGQQFASLAREISIPAKEDTV